MVARLLRLFPPRLMQVVFWLTAVAVLAMALLPHPPGTPLDWLGDKIEHMIAFGTLSVLALLGWPNAAGTRILVALCAFGGLIEVLQATPAIHRDSDWQDWAADTFAIVLALGAARLVLGRPAAPAR